MDAPCKALCEAVAACVVARDFAGVEALLAPWLRASLSAGEIERAIDRACEGLPAPRAWSLDEGLAGLDELRTPDEFGPPSQGLPEAITAQSYRGWLCIQFRPDASAGDAPNACFDLWLAAVEIEGAHLVGYLEAWEAT